MKRIILSMALVGLCQLTVVGQKKYEMVVEKTDGTETIITVKDIARTYFREQNDGGGGDTTCPDGNHPHMIDLGLPSGTKWACCNVGASAPEGYGNYYTWGETAPKASYPQIHVSSLPSEQMDAILKKGFMIAGSAYDAATVNWGSPWHMPTSGQWQEIIDNASIEWTFYNEVGGQRITGPNGNSIFLPAAGMYEGGNLLNLQIGCDYWTAALLEYGEDTYDWSNAKSYEGGMGGASISFFNRGDGLPVRAVR